MVIRKIWSNWSEALILVKPETVVSGIAPDTACFGYGDPAEESGAAEG